MDKNIQKMDKNEIIDGNYSSFISSVLLNEMNPKTQPSAIAINDVSEISLRKLSPFDIEKFLWLHPVAPRGIEIKTNRMIHRGFYIEPYDDSKEAKQAAESMQKLLENSGNELFIKKWAENAYAFGDGFCTLVENKTGDKIVKLNIEHPIFFRIYREQTEETESTDYFTLDNKVKEYNGMLDIDNKTRKAASFTQVELTTDNIVKPVGKRIPANRVGHLTFDTWGDEVQGISIIQYIYLQIKYLLNLEAAGAEAEYRAGFTQKKVTTDIMTDKQLKKLAKNLKQISSKDAIILPKGTDVNNLLPGTSQFPQFHDVFLNLIAIRLGIPKPLLTLDGTSTNKATIQEQRKDMMADFFADELMIKRTIEDQIFTYACELEFGEDFEKIPRFFFKPFIETDEQIVAKRKDQALTIESISRSLDITSKAGYTDIAKKLTDFLETVLQEFSNG